MQSASRLLTRRTLERLKAIATGEYTARSSRRRREAAAARAEKPAAQRAARKKPAAARKSQMPGAKTR